MVPESDTRPTDRSGVLWPDQPVDLRHARRTVALVLAAGATANDGADGHQPRFGFGWPRATGRAGLLCDQSHRPLWTSLEVLRPKPEGALARMERQRIRSIQLFSR